MRYSEEVIKQIQNDFDIGCTQQDIIDKYGMSYTTIAKYNKTGILKTINKSDAMKRYCRMNPRIHSEESKKKISIARKKFLKEHPEKVPYLLNHSSKISYPEQYFIDVFKKEEIDLMYHKQVGLYQLDFYNEDKMIYVEIDGNSHYLDKKTINIDKRRTEVLNDLGWTGIRIRWSDYKNKSLEERTIVIKRIKDLINNAVTVNDILDTKDNIKRIESILKYRKKMNIFTCEGCGKEKDSNSKYCIKCSGIRRRIERPDKELLTSKILSSNYTEVAKEYNVSSNAIRRWCKDYGIEISKDFIRNNKINMFKNNVSDYRNIISNERQLRIICPNCGQKKQPNSKTCRNCYQLLRA